MTNDKLKVEVITLPTWAGGMARLAVILPWSPTDYQPGDIVRVTKVENET